MKAMSRKGFTLIEILIVVIILGILAAIVIPQFASASDDAKKSSVRSTVQSVRGQVQLYKLQHNDLYPTADGTVDEAFEWEKLSTYTDVTGADFATKAEAQAHDGKAYGPYMQEVPINPFNGLSNVGTEAGTDVGWVFDADGRFWGVDKDGALIMQAEAAAGSGS